MPLTDDVRKAIDFGRRTVGYLRARRSVGRLLAGRAPITPGTVEALVYFSDPVVNAYQITQWFEPLRLLGERHPVAVVCRDWETADHLLRESPIPVHHALTIADVENFLTTHPVRIIFYVNQNQANFSAFRFADPAHVFICHGESDKDYMSSNQLKAYDWTFIAGQAARERIARKLIDFDLDRLIEIGRPQVDVTYAGPDLPRDDRTVVLYAPTWEGDRPTMTYGSTASHGPAMARALVATGRHRVIYRPHPRTGVTLRSAGEGDAEVRRILTAANAADPRAGHVVDTGPNFGWQIGAADLCIADISAVTYDWLATGKPMVVTRPADPKAEVETTGLVAALDLLPAESAPDIVRVLDALTEPDQAHRDLVTRYFGDTTPGASMQRWLDACGQVIAERTAALEQRAARNGAQSAAGPIASR